MIATFQDLQNDDNPRNGQTIHDQETVASLLEELRNKEPPIACQFTGDNGYNLIVGIGRDFGCAQHSSNDGMPPYMMAVSQAGAAQDDDIEFLMGNTPTPIDGRYRVAFDEVLEIVVDFVTKGDMSTNVSWMELE
jgi:hypothetical protein